MDTQLFRDTFVAFHMSWIIIYTVQSQPVLYRYISSVSLVFQLLMHISKGDGDIGDEDYQIDFIVQDSV